MNTKYWDLFIRHKAGELNPDELHLFIAWQKSDPDAYKEMEEIYFQSDEEIEPTFNAQKDWKDLKAILATEANNRPATVKLFPWIARIAATIIVFLGVIYIFYQQSPPEPHGLAVQTLVRADDTSVRQLILPDNSQIWLNKGSEILYAAQFDDATRTVYLKGEAYFEVTPDKNRPFIIHAGKSKTTVIGTSFNLRAYSMEDEVRLTVVTGKVAFAQSDDRDEVIVTPGNMASLVSSNMTIATGANNDVNFLSWKTHQLIFDNLPLHELLGVLEKHYTTTIKLEKENLGHCRFTGNFTNTGLEDVLSIITRSVGGNFTENNGVFIIQGEGCN